METIKTNSVGIPETHRTKSEKENRKKSAKGEKSDETSNGHVEEGKEFKRKGKKRREGGIMAGQDQGRS